MKTDGQKGLGGTREAITINCQNATERPAKMGREAPHFFDEAFLLHFRNLLARQLIRYKHAKTATASEASCMQEGNTPDFFYIRFNVFPS